MLAVMRSPRWFDDCPPAPLVRPRVRRSIVARGRLAVALGVASLAWIVAPAPARAVTFDQALLSAARAPQLRGLQQAAEVRARQDKQLPSMSGNPEFAAALGPGGPTLGPSVQLNAAQSWNLGDLGPSRARAAAAERDLLGAELRLELLRTQLLAAQAWIGLRVAAQARALADQEAQLATDLADAVTRSAARGTALQADAAEALAWAAEARLAALSLEGRVREAAAELATQAVLQPRPVPTAEGAWPSPQLPSAAAWRAQVQAVATAPAAVQWRLLAQADRLRGAEAEAAQASSLSLGGQFQRDSDGTWAVFATAGLRWSAFDRGQRAKAVAAEAVEKNLGQALQAEHQAAVELDVAEHEVEYTRETLAMLEKSLIPALQSLVAARQEAYRRGTGSLVDLLRARRGLLEAQRRHAGASGDRAWAEVKAWMLLATLRQEARP